MSTRCVVKIFVNNCPGIQYYHHCDGYESYMIPDLTEILGKSKNNGIYNMDLFKTTVEKQGGYEEEIWGTSHGDLEWMYFVYIDKFMKTVYIDYCKVNMNSDEYSDIFDNPENHADIMKCADENGKPLERLQLDIPDEYYELLEKEADKKEITVDKLINNILKEAIKSGKLEEIIMQIKNK